jgi:protoporphyrinogen oxidase
MSSVVVLGGGISGLACALELQRRGLSVTILEAGPHTGGLARTIDHDGYRFDLGGHRFHSNNPDVVRWIRELLPHDLLTVQRQSRIRINGHFVDYPLQLGSALGAFAPLQSLRMAASYAAARATGPFRPDVTFQDWIVKRFGHSLFEAFFRPYTEKVWGMPCHSISADWASQRIGLPSLTQALRQALIPAHKRSATSVSQFLYPRRGFGMIQEALCAEIRGSRGQIITNAKPVSVRGGANEVEVGFTIDGRNERIGASWLISTVPPAALLGLMIDDDDARWLSANWPLRYRDLICLFLEIDRPRVSNDHWTYFPAHSLMFGRTHEPKNWSAEMVPHDDRTSLVVEVFATRGDSIWQMEDDAIAARAVRELEQIDFLPRASVRSHRVVRLSNVYPVYGVGYETTIERFRGIVSKHPRVRLAGRTGLFRYMNSDGVIENAMETAASIAPDVGTAIRPLDLQEGRWA